MVSNGTLIRHTTAVMLCGLKRCFAHFKFQDYQIGFRDCQRIPSIKFFRGVANPIPVTVFPQIVAIAQICTK